MLLYPQGQTTCRAVQQPLYEDRDDTVVQIVDGIGGAPSEFNTDRVLKVEGVEEVLGGVLQNSVVRLNREHQVMKGEPLSPTLTSACLNSGDVAKDFYNERAGPNALENGGASMTGNSLSEGRNRLDQETGQQILLCARQEDHSTCAPQESTLCPEEEDCCSSPEALQAATVSVEHMEDSLAGNFRPRTFGPAGPQDKTCSESSVLYKSTHGKLSFLEDHSVAAKNGYVVEQTVHADHESSVAQLLFKADQIRELEIKLADAELEIVELKIDLEVLRVQIKEYREVSQSDLVQQVHLELQTYKDKCQNYEEEMRLVLKQFPNSVDNLQKERQLLDVIEENQFLQDCLAKAKKHVLRSKAWRDELRKWKDIENTRREACSDFQAVSVRNSITSLTDIRLETRDAHKHLHPGAMPVCVYKNGGNSMDDARRVRPALRLLDLNARTGADSDLHANRKGRRQLQFPGDENCQHSNLNSKSRNLEVE